MENVDYTDTFITVAPDATAAEGIVPPPKAAGPTIASATYELLAGHPYRYTSGDVIFTVWADRRDLPESDRPAARAEFYAKPRACLRASDLGKRFGWGIHADEQGRLALYPVGSVAYEGLASGNSPAGREVTVRQAMRSGR